MDVLDINRMEDDQHGIGSYEEFEARTGYSGKDK